MLESLFIQNVLSHNKTKLEFSPGVNIFVGPSGSGKSAIMQSLNWLFTLRPNGDEHRSWNNGIMKVKVKFQEGNVLKLIKDKQSMYALQTKTGKQVFKGFGQKIPENIQQIINIDSKINIQRQLERGVPIFLISESPGDVAKFFNRVAGLDKIDLVQGIGKLSLKETQKEVESLKEQIKEKEQELDDYGDLRCIYQKSVKAYEIENLQVKNEQKKDKINSILDKINELKKLNKILQRKTTIKDKISDVLDKFNNIRKWKENRNKLEVIQKDIICCESNIQTTKRKKEILPKVKMVLKLIEKIKNLKEYKTNIILKQNNIKCDEQSIKYTENEINKKAKIFHDNFPKQCPLCGRT